MCGGRHDRDAEAFAQGVDINGDAASGRQIPHVQDEDDGDLEIPHLAEQVEIPFEVGGVDDADDGVGTTDILQTPEHDVDRDHLVGRSGRKTVGAGQVDEGDFTFVVTVVAGFFLDGHAGEVADARLHSGERTKQRALAGVGISDQDDGQLVGGR